MRRSQEQFTPFPEFGVRSTFGESKATVNPQQTGGLTTNKVVLLCACGLMIVLCVSYARGAGFFFGVSNHFFYD